MENKENELIEDTSNIENEIPTQVADETTSEVTNIEEKKTDEVTNEVVNTKDENLPEIKTTKVKPIRKANKPVKQVSQQYVAPPMPQANPYVNQPQGFYQQNQAYQQMPNQYPQQGFYNNSVPNYPQGNYGVTPPMGYVPSKQKNPKAFIITMSVVAVLSVFSLLYVLMFSLSENQMVLNPQIPDNSGSNPSVTPIPGYGDDDEEETNNGLAEGFIKNPDIEIPDSIDELIINNEPITADLEPNTVYNKVVASTVTIEVQVETTTAGVYISGTGSGIFISSDGFILTNSHVIENSKNTVVKITDYLGNDYPAVVVAYDKATDLAVLKTEDHNFTTAEFGNSDQLLMGQWVMAIGNPGGSVYSGSITRGIVSGLNREVGYSTEDTMRYIQTDAAINPGNSGGPLVNMHGQVIGINTSKIVADYYEGMCFSIPINDAVEIVNELLTKGYVSGRVRLGITAKQTPYGLQIYTIDEKSSFANTEVKEGDIIVSVNGNDISELDDLTAEFLSYSPGDQVTVELMRASQNSTDTYEVTITLLADEGETQQ